MLQMRIGNAHYQCSCVNYLTSESHFSLIVGLSVGLGVPLIIAIIALAMVFACRKKQAGQRGVSSDNTYTGQEDKTYSRPYTCSTARYCSDYENLDQYESGEYADIK